MKTQPFHLTWQGRLSLEEVIPLRDSLLAALNQHDNVTIDVGEVVSFDLACLQLLCAACGSATIRGKRLRLHGAANPALAQVLAENGLNYRENCLRSRSCLWPQEEGNDRWRKES